MEDLKIEIEISKNNMQAECLLKGSRDKEVTEDIILFHLKKSGVEYGIDPESIKKLIYDYNANEKKFVKVTSVIAQGTPSEKAQDASLEILVPPIEKVLITDDDKADYRNIKKFRRVKKGEIVAKKHPGLPGKYGINIFNQVLQTAPPKDITIEYGENIEFNEKENTFISKIYGIFEEGKDSINVNPLLNIQGDVGIETGNIDYNGEVRVGNNIEREASLKSQGDLWVGGIIESGNIVSGGSIKTEGGINTKKQGQVLAHGELKSNYIENSNVAAIKNIIVDYSIVNSNIITYQDLSLNSMNSSIVGGELIVFGSITTGNIGNRNHITTKIKIGFHDFYNKEYDKIQKSIREVQKNFEEKLQKIQELKNDLKKLQGKLSQKKAIEFQSQLKEYKLTLFNKERLEKKAEIYKNAIYNKKEVKLVVYKRIYPGVEITYHNERKRITVTLEKVLFRFIPSTQKIVIENLPSP